MPVDVRRSPELQAAILATRQAEREIRLDINKTARQKLRPIWQAALMRNLRTDQERAALIPGAKIIVGTRGISAVAANTSRALEGGLVPSIRDDIAGVEWGSSRSKQFRPRQGGNRGYVVGPAAAETISGAITIWVATVVDKFRANYDVKGP